MEELEILIDAIKHNDYTGPNGEALRDLDFDRVEETIAKTKDDQAEFLEELDDIYYDLKDMTTTDLEEVTDHMFEEWVALVERLGKLL